MRLESNLISRFVNASEEKYSQAIYSLRHSEEKGVKGHLIRQVASRVAAIALPIFALCMFVLKLVAGVVDLATGVFSSLSHRELDKSIFSSERATAYFASLAKSLAQVPLLGVFHPDIACSLLKPSEYGPLTDAITPRVPIQAVDQLQDTRDGVSSSRTKVNQQALAVEALRKMSDEEMDKNWQLDKFFGAVRVINLDRDKQRMAAFRQNSGTVGLTEGRYERFRGCDGRKELDRSVWNRMKSNYRCIFTLTAKGRAKLDRQHMGQIGCYMSHYLLIKETAENYEAAKKELSLLNQDPGATEEQIKDAEAKVKKYSSVLILEDDNEFGMILPKDVTVKSWRGVVFSDKLTHRGAGRVFYEAMRDLPEDWDMLYFMAQPYQKARSTHSKRLKKLKEADCLNAYAVNACMYPKLLKQLGKIEHETASLRPVDTEIKKLHRKSNCYVVTPALAVQDGRGSSINGYMRNNQKLRYMQAKNN